tara:strand:+ start:238 stop:921 length:684 start_codon:yes stop_codon:yes gene_type:complete
LLIITAAVLSVFPACNLKIFGNVVFNCTEAVDQETSTDQNPDQIVENLLKRIRNLEVQLATRSCAYVEYEKKEFDPPEALRKTDLDAWERKDLGALAGCWTLTGSAQKFVPISCRHKGGTNCPETRSSNAVYCFNSAGTGNVKTEIDGKFCKANLKAEFSQESQLIFKELADQICPVGIKFSDGSGLRSLISSNYTCRITVDNKAECEKKDRLDTTNKIILVRKQDE